MSCNPLIDVVEKLRAELRTLRTQEQQVSEELRKYELTNVVKLSASRDASEASAAICQRDLTENLAKQTVAQRRIAELSVLITHPLNPVGWFSSAQKGLRATCKAEQATAHHLKQAERSLYETLDIYRTRVSALEKEVVWWKAFDAGRAANRLVLLQSQIKQTERNIEIAVDRRRRIDEALKPVVDEISRLEGQRRSLETEILAAQSLDDRLTYAHNSYQRREVHIECRGRFGDGSPNRVTAKLRRRLEHLDVELSRQRHRAQEVSLRAQELIVGDSADA